MSTPSKPAGTRPTKRKSPRKQKTSKRLERLTQVPQRDFTVGTLEVDTLRPLVDLAYWSTFLEVRRDAAAAFATLAMNEANLEVLSQAGTLGALLALVGINSGKNDSQVHRDAATALSYLVTLDDIKHRLLKAPDGLNSIFYMCRSPNVDVKRAAVKTLANLATLDVTKEAIVDRGGIRCLFALTSSKDEKTKRRAARVLKRLSTHGPNHERIAADPQALRCTITLLLDCPDLTIRRDMIEMLTYLASSDERKVQLVAGGVIGPLMMHLDPTHASLETIMLVIRCLHTLSQCADVRESMVVEGVVEALSRVIFEELAEIREYRSSRPAVATSPRAAAASPSSASPGGNGGSHSAEDNALRVGLSIIYNLSMLEENRQALLDRNVVEYLLDNSIMNSRDKKVRRPVGKILANIADAGGDVSPRHGELLAKGILRALRVFFSGGDYELKSSAARMLSHLSVPPAAKVPIAQSGVLEPLIRLCSADNDTMNVWIARTIAELSADSTNEGKLVQAGCISKLILMITPRCKKKEARLEAVRALSNLSSSDGIKLKLVGAGALGYLISMSKSGTGLAKMYAIATLTNLEHDTAALRIQMLFRGLLGRREFKRRREAAAKDKEGARRKSRSYGSDGASAVKKKK